MPDQPLFCIPRRELGVVMDLIHEYMLHTMPDLKAPEILDVGAHGGAFAVYSLHRWRDGRVTSFEPHPETYKLLVGNTAGLPVLTRNFAVEHPVPPSGKIRLLEGVEDQGRHACSTKTDVIWEAGTAGEHRSQQLDKFVECPVFDAADLPPAQVAKIDHEGGEDITLRAWKHLRGCRVLLVECHPRGRESASSAMEKIASIAEGSSMKLVGQSGTVLRFVRQ